MDTTPGSFNKYWVRRQKGNRFSHFTPDIVVVHDLDGIEPTPDKVTGKNVSWLEDVLQTDYPHANILSFCPIANAVVDTLLTGRGLHSQARELLATIQREREEKNRSKYDTVLIGSGIGLLIVKQALVIADLDQKFRDIVYRITHVGLLAQHRADDKRQIWEELSVNMAHRLNNIYGWSIPVTLTQLSIAMQETEWAFLKVSGDYKALTFQESVPFRTQGHSEVLDTWQELSDKMRPSAASASAGPTLNDAYHSALSRFSLSHFQHGLSSSSPSNALRQLLSDEAYSAWKNNKESSILCLYGTNGVGKTTIAQGISMALASAGDTGVVVYFSFGNLDILHRSTASLLKTLIFKILSTIPATWNAIQDISVWIQQFHHITINELWILLRLLCSSRWLSRVFFIIDDIDKCTDGLVPRLEALLKMGDASDVQIKILTTGQSALVSMDSWSVSTINLSLPAWKEGDIGSAITSTTQEVIRQNHGLAELERNIIDGLKHCNSPIEVNIRLKALCQCARPLTSLSAQSNLSILEKPLPDLYAQLLGPLEKLDPWVRTALSLMSLSFRPLKLHDLAIVINLGLEIKDREDVVHSLPLDLGGDLTRALGVLVDLRDETAKFSHQSVTTYIQDQMTMQINQGTISPADGILTHGDLARRCLTYLRLFDLDSGPPATGYKTFLRSNDLDFTSYAVMHWPSHYTAHQDRKSLVQDILDFFALEKPRTQWAQWRRAGQSTPEINDLPMTPIALSAQHGLLEVVQQLLLQSGDKSISSEERTEALEMALHFGHLDVARELLHSLSPSKRAISLAARMGDLPLLKELIEKTEDPHSYALNCLETAAFCGHLGVINTFLELLPDARTFLNYNASVYRQSVRGGQLHILKRLLEVGTPPLPAETGTTLLHLSAEAGDLQMIGLLQTYDVEINCINEDGQTLLYHAVAAGHARVVAELAPKITPWGVDHDGLSPLHIAAIQGNMAVFMELIKCKPDVTATNNQGDQPIHLAAERGHFDIVVQLLNMGLDPKAANHDGFNLLHLAARGGHLAMVKDLLRRTKNSFSTNTGSNQKWGDQCAENPRVDPRSNSDKGIYDASKESSDRKNDTESKVNEDTEECEEEEGEGEDGDGGQTEEEEEEAVGEEDEDITYEPTPLHSAALKGYVEVIEVLLPHADDTLGNSYGSTPLHLAVRGGHTAAVKYLLSQGSSLGVCDTHGRQPIHLACDTGNLFILQMLLKNGSSFEATDDQGNTPLHISTESGHEQLVQALLDIGADVNHKQRGSGGSCLHIAAKIGHEGIVKLLIGAGVSLDEQDGKGRTALHVSLTHFREEVATCLLDRGADHNTRDIEGQTPLYSAIINGIDFRTIEKLQPSHDQVRKMIESDPMLIHTALRAKQGQRVIALLMHSGWNPLVKDENGETPLQLALKLGLPIEAEQLLERMNPDIPSIKEYSESLIDMSIQGFTAGVRKVLAYAEVDLEVKGGTYHQTPLAFAAENGKNDVVRLLLEKGADPNAKDDDDVTPILVAVWDHHKEIVTQLIDAEADIDARNILGYTSLDLAVLVRDAELVNLLLERGASIPNSEGREVTNILRQSIQEDHLQITEILLRNGANPFEVDSKGKTAIHEAAEAANPAFLEALLRNGTKSLPEGFEWTPLHLAAMVGDTELIRSHETHAHAKDTKGRTALHWATLRGHLEAVKILFDMQTDLKAQDEDGMTALHLSATQGNIDIVRFLADKGDQCSVWNVDGWSPIHLARSCGYEDTVSFLSDIVSLADAALAGFSPEWVSVGNTTGILVKDDGRQVIIENVTGDDLEERCQVRTKHPMPVINPVYYYEIAIIRLSPGRIMGLGFCEKDSSLRGMPGWREKTWGYHADDGGLFSEYTTATPFGPQYYVGDVVGCGVDFIARSAFFTHNGNFIRKFKFDCKGRFYPVLGFGENGIEIPPISVKRSLNLKDWTAFPGERNRFLIILGL